MAKKAYKIDKPYIPIEKSYIMLNSLLSSSVNKAGGIAQKKGASFMIASTCNLLLEIDIDMVEDAIASMLESIILATPDIEVVTIRTKKLEGNVEITISCNLPEEKSEECTMSNANDALFLPLYNARRCIELEGGNIDKGKSNQREGIVFTFTLPAN